MASEENKTHYISAWGYVGYTILFCIPVVGLILNLIFCFIDGNPNRKHFARSFWCIPLLLLVLLAIWYVILMIRGIDVIVFMQDYLKEINKLFENIIKIAEQLGEVGKFQ